MCLKCFVININLEVTFYYRAINKKLVVTAIDVEIMTNDNVE